MAMINRILERLEEELNESGVIDDDDYFLGKFTAYNDAISIVKEESQNSGWIPVGERLPDTNESVLITIDVEGELYIATAEHHAGIWCIADEFYSYTLCDYEVIAWQPLPEPYEGV